VNKKNTEVQEFRSSGVQENSGEGCGSFGHLPVLRLVTVKMFLSIYKYLS
jgi:hypothetical protein